MSKSEDANFILSMTMTDVQRLLDDAELWRHESERYKSIVAQKMEQVSANQNIEPGHYSLTDLRDARATVIQALQHLYDVAHNLHAGGETGTITLDGGDVLDACDACWQATDAMAKMQWRWEELHPTFAKGGSEWTREQMGKLKDGENPED